MKYILFLIISIYCSIPLYSQPKIHYHKNKRISTIEVWNKEKRSGKFYCMNARGDTLIAYSLRRFAGYSSAYADYYPNGQAKKVELSSAPDGGIQFYREIIYYDEKGKETGRTDLSYPQEITHTINPEYKKSTPILPKDKQSVFYISNQTAYQIKLKLIVKNKTYSSMIRTDSAVVIAPFSNILIDSVMERFFIFPKNNYEISFISSPSSKLKILSPEEDSMENNRKEWTWYVVSNRR